jgi:hypothetical protein
MRVEREQASVVASKIGLQGLLINNKLYKIIREKAVGRSAIMNHR